MAFQARIEFWKLSTTGDGIASVVLDDVVADAMDLSAATAGVVDLPVRTYNYGMFVYGFVGSCVVEKSEDPQQDQKKGRLVAEGTGHWFIIKPGDKLYVSEYVG